MAERRHLGPGDERALFGFLDQHIESSLFLVSNAEAGGLEDVGAPLQGTYVASFEDGGMTAVAAHYWNGMLIVQGERGLEQSAREAVARSGRPVSGLIGPLALVERVRRALDMQTRAAKKDEPEILYALSLERLRIPPLLSTASLTCRPPTDEENAGLLIDWRMDYMAEALGADRTASLREEVRKEFVRPGRVGWVLLVDGRPVSYSTFNARARGVVQVGGVFTPPELRARGYARAVVAGSLLDARRH